MEELLFNVEFLQAVKTIAKRDSVAENAGSEDWADGGDEESEVNADGAVPDDRNEQVMLFLFF